MIDLSFDKKKHCDRTFISKKHKSTIVISLRKDEEKKPWLKNVEDTQLKLVIY